MNIDVTSLKLTRSTSDLFEFSRSGDLVGCEEISEFILFLKSQIPTLEKEFGVKLSGKVDCAVFKYDETDYLLPHDDASPGRKIAYVYYLSSCTGGELVKYKDGVEFDRIVPSVGKFIVFPVGTMHEVKEVVSGSRVSLAGWYYGN